MVVKTPIGLITHAKTKKHIQVNKGCFVTAFDRLYIKINET